MTLREQFEAFVVNFHRGSSLEGETHTDTDYPALNGQFIYDDWNVQSAWACWQASRKALVVELPKSRGEQGERANGDGGRLSALVANQLAIDACREAIQAQGLKVQGRES